MAHNIQTAFAVFYPSDALIVPCDNLADARVCIKESEIEFANGGTDYAGAYIVIWTGEEWDKYYG